LKNSSIGKDKLDRYITGHAFGDLKNKKYKYLIWSA